MLAIPTSGINCGDAVSALISCESYLLGMGDPKPTLPCCNSAQALKKIVVSKPDRQSLCECFMQIAPTLGVNFKRANQLLSSCKLNLNMTITSDMDCKKLVLSLSSLHTYICTHKHKTHSLSLSLSLSLSPCYTNIYTYVCMQKHKILSLTHTTHTCMQSACMHYVGTTCAHIHKKKFCSFLTLQR